MATPTILFPEGIDVIMPILDGWTPITPADLNVYGAVVRRIEEVLGAGVNQVTTSPKTYGPAGGNTDLASRLDKFLELDGTPKDIALVTGSAKLGEFFQNGTGKFVGFGKTLSRIGDGTDSYHVLFDCKIQGSVEESSFGSGLQKWDYKIPCCWWVQQKRQDGVYIAARNQKGIRIEESDSTTVEFCLLAIGYDAFSVA